MLAPRDDFYQDRPPTADDVLLLIEVADSSLQYDQAVKLPLYARAGVREVWLVDLVRNEVQVHREPTPGGFGFVERRGRGATRRADRVPRPLAPGRRTCSAERLGATPGQSLGRPSTRSPRILRRISEVPARMPLPRARSA